MKRRLPLILLLLATGCIDFEGATDPRWYEDEDLVMDDDCMLRGYGYAPDAEVVSEVTFVPGGRELVLSCGTAFVQGYYQYWRPDTAGRPDTTVEYSVVVTSSEPFIVWKSEMTNNNCPEDEACAVGELVDGEYRAQLTATSATRYDDATAVIGLGTIEDVGEGSATIRVTKIGGYGSGGAGGGPSTSE